MSDMGQFLAPNLELSSSYLASSGSKAPITIVGYYTAITAEIGNLYVGGSTGPMADVSTARQQIAGVITGINFDNSSYDGRPEPSDTAGDSYISATDNLGVPVWYTVVGGGSARQTTLAGTTAGTFVRSMPGEASSFKRFVVHYTGYNNSSAIPQTVTYPVPFTLTPKITFQ